MNLNIAPSLDRLKSLSGDYAYLPVYASCYADTETPISVFKRLEHSENCFLLDSVEGGEKWARYSFLSKDPLALIRSKGGITVVTYRNGTTETLSGVPTDTLKNLMARFSGPDFPELPLLYGGAVGFVSYDSIRYQEHLPNPPKDDTDIPDLCFMVADEMIVFDHIRQRLIFIVNIPSNGNLEDSYEDALKRLESLYNLSTGKAEENGRYVASEPKANKATEVIANMTRSDYLDAVRRAKKHIFDGDIFQIVLSQRFTMKAPPSPFDVYRLLRVTNPSPYMFYIKFNDFILAGASPELLLRSENGVIETCPIAGTRKRGKTPEEDTQLEADLLNDEKEKSEHIMLLDLGRNDIGRVSEFDSVKVSKYMEVVRFSKVMHLSSTVEGQLKKNLTPIDALMSVFPAGTLSGAPKVRAMELIDTFEPTRRGVYGGAIGYLSFDGNLDSCITIRTILFKDGLAHVQAGAGIVADSIPENEYDECLNKAMAMISAIKEAGDSL